jgi:hypothetical protein
MDGPPARMVNSRTAARTRNAASTMRQGRAGKRFTETTPSAAPTSPVGSKRFAMATSRASIRWCCHALKAAVGKMVRSDVPRAA